MTRARHRVRVKTQICNSYSVHRYGECVGCFGDLQPNWRKRESKRPRKNTSTTIVNSIELSIFYFFSLLLLMYLSFVNANFYDEITRVCLYFNGARKKSVCVVCTSMPVLVQFY